MSLQESRPLSANEPVIMVLVAEIFVAVLLFSPVCTQVTLPNQPIKDALYLHNASISNNTLRDCVFLPNTQKVQCRQVNVRYYLYSGHSKEKVDQFQSDWLLQSIWDHTKEDIILVHGYAGGDGALPMTVLRDAYITNGSYNVWVLDWGDLGQPPCYRAAVHNLKSMARCAGDLLMNLRSAGLPTDRMTCVGHSLGAHICGLISRYVLFRMHRIIALDPARPLIPMSSRVDSGHASAVHVIHTNAGHYGEAGKSGHVDFCVNGGRIQPFCEDSGLDIELCSHVWAVCYMAESLFPNFAKKAEPCSRRCPSGPRPGNRIGVPIYMGQFTPLYASGSYCIQENYPPFCPKEAGGEGDKRCCLQAPRIMPPPTTEGSMTPEMPVTHFEEVQMF